MSKLIYTTDTSLDGYVEDETGAFDRVDPDQVHAFITESLQPIGTNLYGRRLYETMAYWDGPVEAGGGGRDLAREHSVLESTSRRRRDNRMIEDFGAGP